MPFRSLRARLILLFLLSLGLAGTVFAVVAARQFESQERARSRAELQRQVVGLVRMQEFLSEQVFTGATKFPREMTDRIRDLTGTIYYAPIADGLDPPAGVNFALAPSNVVRQLNWQQLTGGGTQTFEAVVGSERVVAAAHRERIGQTAVGAVILTRPASSLSAGALTQSLRVVPALVAAMLAAGVLVLLLSRRVTRPVRELSAASDQIAKGLYDIKLSSKGDDELGRLAASFEDMARRLKSANEAERNFLMRISHELRTPLTAIQGHVQAIADGVIDGEHEKQVSLEIVLVECERLRRLVGDLLDLARLQARAFSLASEPLTVRELCAHAVLAQGAEARARHVTLSESYESSAVVFADGDRLMQVIGNLLTNGIRATPNGGEVTVSVRDHASGSVVIGIADSGPGVSIDRRESIFRPFVTGGEGGVGLGLPIAMELTEAMGGTLVVRGRLGGGALFEVVLPTRDVARAGAGERAEGSSALSA